MILQMERKSLLINILLGLKRNGVFIQELLSFCHMDMREWGQSTRQAGWRDF